MLADPQGRAPDLSALVARLGLGEVRGEGGGPRLVLTAELRGESEIVGRVRHFRGELRRPLALPGRGEAARPGLPVEEGGTAAAGSAEEGVVELLDLRLAVPTSAAPHLLFGDLTTGAPGAPGASTITADLLPRLDLTLHPDHVDRIYGALAPGLEEFARRSADACDEVSMVLEGPLRRRVLVSPWASRLTALAGPPSLGGDLFRVYADRWIELLSAGRTLIGRAEAWDPEPAARDRRLRAVLSETPEEPLWRELRRLCGPAQASAVQALVRGEL